MLVPAQLYKEELKRKLVESRRKCEELARKLIEEVVSDG